MLLRVKRGQASCGLRLQAAVLEHLQSLRRRHTTAETNHTMVGEINLFHSFPRVVGLLGGARWGAPGTWEGERVEVARRVRGRARWGRVGETRGGNGACHKFISRSVYQNSYSGIRQPHLAYLPPQAPCIL